MPELIHPGMGITLPDATLPGMSITHHEAMSGLPVLSDLPRKRGLILPHQATSPHVHTAQILLPTQEELLQYGVREKETQAASKRKSSEFALAFDQPHKFIANEAEKKLKTNHTAGIANVISILRSQGTGRWYDEEFDQAVIHRQTKEKRFTNMTTGEKRRWYLLSREI